MQELLEIKKKYYEGTMSAFDVLMVFYEKPVRYYDGSYDEELWQAWQEFMLSDEKLANYIKKNKTECNEG